MTRREVLAWLDARRPAPPPALRVHLDAAVTDSGAGVAAASGSGHPKAAAQRPR